MKLLQKYPIPNRKNALIVGLQLTSVLICFFLLRYVNSAFELLILALVFGIVMNSVYASIHEAHHRVLFSNRKINDAFGFILALFFPASFHLLRQGHIGHHRKNRTDDEAFDLYFDRDIKFLKYVSWYGILTGGYWLVVVASSVVLVLFPFLMNPRFYSWDKTTEIFLGHFEMEKLPTMRIEALCVIIVQIGIFYLIGISFFNYACMYFGFGLMWSSLQYVHHYQAERDVVHGAFNLHTWKLLDVVWLNHNWHKTHHQRPTIPWCYLPALAEESETETLPLFPAYVRMWKGPVHAKEGTHKKFEGPISN